jgi:hypothetical protein
MSLKQHGNQTDRNKNKAMKGSKEIQLAIPKAVKLNRDAHVLTRTCAACENLVVGFRKPSAIPMTAAEFTSSQLGTPITGNISASIKGT